MDATTVEHRDGVELEKRIEEEEYDFSSVVYEFTSESTDPVTVEVTESVSKPLERHQLGFHTNYEPEQYEVVDGELVLDIELEPESERTVTYALRPSAAVDIEELAAAPTEFSVSPVEGPRRPDEATDTNHHSNEPRDGQEYQESHKTGSATGESADQPQHGTEAETPLKPTHADGPEQSIVNTPDPDSATDQSEDGSLVDQLAAELESGRGSERSFEYLDQRFGSTQHNSGSMDARIRQLQREFADLRAYTGALEEFIDENGSGREIIDSFGERLDTVENDTASLESAVSHQESEVTDLRDDLQTVKSEVESVSAELDSLEQNVRDLSEEIAVLDDQLPDDDLEDRFAELEAELSQVTEFTSKLQNAFQDSFTS
jgi:archaellum component FlaC